MNTQPSKNQHKPESSFGKSLRTYALISQTLFEAALILAIPIVAGRYLDQHWLNTTIPWATLAGTLLGFTGMLWRFLRLITLLNRNHTNHNTTANSRRQ